MRSNAAQAEKTLKLLANAKRLIILCNLVEGDKTVGELGELVELSQSALSQHLAKMRKEGFIEADKQGQLVYYHIKRPEVQAILNTLYNIYCKK